MAMLYAAGHVHAERYTPEAARLFVAAIDRADQRRRKAALFDARAAGAEQKSFEAYLRKMR